MVPGEVTGGGIGLSVRKRGWTCSWSVEPVGFGPDGRRVGAAKGGVNVAVVGEVLGLMLPVRGIYTWGRCGRARAGGFGRDGFSGDEPSGKGPSRGCAGETGRLPGIVSSLGIWRVAGGTGEPSTLIEDSTSQVSKPSDSRRKSVTDSEWMLAVSVGNEDERMSRDREVIGFMN